jgi:hypothetical protein
MVPREAFNLLVCSFFSDKVLRSMPVGTYGNCVLCTVERNPAVAMDGCWGLYTQVSLILQGVDPICTIESLGGSTYLWKENEMLWLLIRVNQTWGELSVDG